MGDARAAAARRVLAALADLAPSADGRATNLVRRDWELLEAYRSGSGDRRAELVVGLVNAVRAGTARQ